jgi:AcrR family transcriptional regulator
MMAPRAKNQQRALVDDALLELCYERGFAAITVEALCERAGTEQADFERRFESLEDCLCQTLEALRDDFFAYLDCCLAGQDRWVDRLRTIAYGLLRYLRADQARTHFLAVELHLAGERATLIWTETILGPLLDRIDEGRVESGSSAALSRSTAEAIGGSIFSRIHVAAAGGEVFEDDELVPQLMYMAVLPYLGEEAARAELSAPAPSDPGATRRTRRG